MTRVRVVIMINRMLVCLFTNQCSNGICLIWTPSHLMVLASFLVVSRSYLLVPCINDLVLVSYLVVYERI